MFSPWQYASKMVSTIQQSSVNIFYINLNKFRGKFNEQLVNEMLSIDEKLRADTFKYDMDKYSFSIARVSIKIICSHLLSIAPQDINIQLSDFGKPYLPDADKIQFNISHSGNLVVLAFAIQTPVGVDVELCNRNFDHLELSKTVFSEREISSLRKVDKRNLIDGFFNCWTKKESYIKAKGLGLQLGLDSFSVRLFDIGTYNLLNAREGEQELKQWQVFNFPVSRDYKAACTCDRSIESVNYLDITDLLHEKFNNN